MLKRDFILIQIEELGKVIAQITSQRNTDAARKTPALIQSVYHSLNIDMDFLLHASPPETRRCLDGEDDAGLQRMEIAARLLLEEAFLKPGKQEELHLKAKELLEYLQANDTTFSLERIFLLEELKK
jgi:hypothetical protein